MRNLKRENKLVVACLVILIYLSINLTSCLGINKITNEQTSANQINLDFDKLNTRKTYSIFIEEKDIVLVDLIKDGGRLNLQVYDQNNKEIYSGDGELIDKFVISVPKKGYYRFEVEGNNAKGSLKVEVK